MRSRAAWLCQGRVCGGALAQDCYGWGTKSVEILLDKIVKNQSPPDVKVIDPLTLVTKENVDSYAENWKKWLKNKGPHP